MPKGMEAWPIPAGAYRRFAERCRQLLPRARTEAARERLLLVVAEFEARAEEIERETSQGGGHRRD